MGDIELVTCPRCVELRGTLAACQEQLGHFTEGVTCWACGVAWSEAIHSEPCDMSHRDTWPHEWISKRAKGLSESLWEANKDRDRLVALVAELEIDRDNLRGTIDWIRERLGAVEGQATENCVGRLVEERFAAEVACREALAAMDEAYKETGYIKVANTSIQRLRIEAAFNTESKTKLEPLWRDVQAELAALRTAFAESERVRCEQAKMLRSMDLGD